MNDLEERVAALSIHAGYTNSASSAKYVCSWTDEEHHWLCHRNFIGGPVYQCGDCGFIKPDEP